MVKEYTRYLFYYKIYLVHRPLIVPLIFSYEIFYLSLLIKSLPSYSTSIYVSEISIWGQV